MGRRILDNMFSMGTLAPIVVVTHSPAIQALLEMIFEEEELPGAFFTSPKEGLAFLKENTPMLIVLEDGLNPDAFTLASRIKMIPRLRQIPLVLLAEETDFTKTTAEISGVDHILSKPIDRKRFMALLQQADKTASPPN